MPTAGAERTGARLVLTGPGAGDAERLWTGDTGIPQTQQLAQRTVERYAVICCPAQAAVVTPATSYLPIATAMKGKFTPCSVNEHRAEGRRPQSLPRDCA